MGHNGFFGKIVSQKSPSSPDEKTLHKDLVDDRSAHPRNFPVHVPRVDADDAVDVGLCIRPAFGEGGQDHGAVSLCRQRANQAVCKIDVQKIRVGRRF